MVCRSQDRFVLLFIVLSTSGDLVLFVLNGRAGGLELALSRDLVLSVVLGIIVFRDVIVLELGLFLFFFFLLLVRVAVGLGLFPRRRDGFLLLGGRGLCKKASGLCISQCRQESERREHGWRWLHLHLNHRLCPQTARKGLKPAYLSRCSPLHRSRRLPHHLPPHHLPRRRNLPRLRRRTYKVSNLALVLTTVQRLGRRHGADGNKGGGWGGDRGLSEGMYVKVKNATACARMRCRIASKLQTTMWSRYGCDKCAGIW